MNNNNNNNRAIKIGIVTHFHNSINYGGMLQAYALCQFINKLDSKFCAEQITFDMERNYNNLFGYVIEKLIIFTKLPVKKKLEVVKQRIESTKKRDVISEDKLGIIQPYLDSRRAAFRNFEKNNVPHSDKIYNRISIRETQTLYDVFITGSDQVWNMDWYRSTFFLDFVTNGKTKLSYAASIGKEEISTEQEQIIERHLKTFTGVSVREEKAVELVNELSPCGVERVIDPTLLLTRNDWDLFCEEEDLNVELIGKEYIFCYFLGENEDERLLAINYANKNSLKIVTIPFLNGKYIECDEDFGDIVLNDVNPKQLIKIIKNAAYVFTDSFHVTVYSLIYHKQFFVFRRNKTDKMHSRIDSLLSLFELNYRFCKKEEQTTMEYISRLETIVYSVEYPKFEDLRRRSIAFLSKNLNNAD